MALVERLTEAGEGLRLLLLTRLSVGVEIDVLPVQLQRSALPMDDLLQCQAFTVGQAPFVVENHFDAAEQELSFDGGERFRLQRIGDQTDEDVDRENGGEQQVSAANERGEIAID